MTGITAEKVTTALALIDRLENGEQALAPQDAEQLVTKIFEACGYDVTQSGFVGGDQGIDCYFSGTIDGKNQTVAVEVRAGKKPADIKSVQQAFALKNQSSNFDRAMVISKAGFLARALREAEAWALVKLISWDRPHYATGSQSRQFRRMSRRATRGSSVAP
jgi:predicted ATP-grasp superfamily ATP-dependent carboligase